MSQQRYYVDQRSGCIAVCDRIKYEACVKEFGPMPGLHGNDQHVVEYWEARRKLRNALPVDMYEAKAGNCRQNR